MPSISTVELTNTFDEWRQRTNDIVTVINAANSADPVSAITFANSEGGFAVNTVTTNSVTGTLMTGTRLVLTGGNVNFSSANVSSAGNVHQVHVLGGTTIDVSSPSDADSSVSNTFIYNSKIDLNGQKFVTGESTLDLTGATISDLGNVSSANLIATGTTQGTNKITITDPVLSITQSYGSFRLSGTQDFSGAILTNPTITPFEAKEGAVHSSNVVANGAGFLVSTNSAAFAVDAGTANVGIGKYPEISTGANILSTKKPNSSKGRLHIRTEFAAASDTATAVDTFADELVLENGNTDVGMTLLSNTASNGVIAFGDTTDVDAGKILYSHSTDSIHLSVGSPTSTTENANCAIFDNSFGGSLLIPNQATVNDENNNPVKGDLITNIAGKLHINVGASDGATGLYVDSRNSTRKAISVSASQTTMNVFQIDSTTLTSGSAIGIYDNSSDTGARKILHIKQDHLDSTGGTALHVETDGMKGVQIIQNKAIRKGFSLTTNTQHTTKLAEIIHNTTGDTNDDDGITGDTLYVESDSLLATQKTLEVANSSGSMMTVVAGGGVGINDNTPSYKLDVNGNGRFVNDVYFNDDIYVANRIFHQDDVDTEINFGDDTISFTTGNDLQLKLDASTTYLYHNGNQRLQTYDGGVGVTGNVYVTDSIVHTDDTDTKIVFGTNTIDLQSQGESKIAIGTASVHLYYDGNEKIKTVTGGVSVTGTIVASGSSVCANGVECRLRVLDESGTLLNSC